MPLFRDMSLDNQLKMNELILDEARKMVEFDDIPQEILKKQLESILIEDMNVVDVDHEGLYSLEDVKMSSKSLKDKVSLCEKLELWKTDEMSTHQAKATGDIRKKTFVTYEKTLDSVKLTLWNASLWRIQVFFGTLNSVRVFTFPMQGKFGLTTASFFSFMRWITILNVFNTFLVLGLVIVPQITFLTKVSQDGNETDTVCLRQAYKDVSFYPIENEANSVCCSAEYEAKQANMSDNLWNQLLESLFTGDFPV